MITLLVFTACLFVLGLLFGRRFGLMVFALAGGLVVSQYLSVMLSAVAAPYLKQYVAYLPLTLVVLPSLVLLLFAKGRHRKIPARVVNAAVFAGAGLVFAIAAPGTPSSLTDSFPFITAHLGPIIGGLVGLATLEAAFGKPSKKKVEEPAKK